MKKITVLILSVLFSLGAMAQDSIGRSSFQFNAGMGYHHMLYELNEQNSKGYLGGNLQFSYQYHFTKNWYFTTGVQYSIYRSSINIGESNFSTPSVDSEGDNYTLHTDVRNFNEVVHTNLFELPIMAGYEHSIAKGISMSYALGFKFALPVVSTFSTRANQLEMRAYYPQWNVEFDKLPVHGWSEGEVQKTSGTFELKPSMALAAEVGVYLSDYIPKHDIYVGIYADYGISNMAKKAENDVFNADMDYNGFMNSSMLSRLNTVSVGVKVGVRMNYSRSGGGAGNVTKHTEQIPYYVDRIDTVIVTETIIVRDTVEIVKIVEKEVIVGAEKEKVTSLVGKILSSVEQDDIITIQFELNQVDLPYQDEQIQALVKKLWKKRANTKYVLMGFADKLGSEKANKRVVDLRVKAVSKYTKETVGAGNVLEITPDNIHARGMFGEYRSVRIFIVSNEDFKTLKDNNK